MIKKKYKFLIMIQIILYLLCDILVLVFMQQNMAVIAGLTIGTLLSTYRFLSNASLLSKLLGNSSKGFAVSGYIIKYISGQTAMLVLIAVSLKVSMWLFAGLVTGLLLMTLSIMILAFTAVLGIPNDVID